MDTADNNLQDQEPGTFLCTSECKALHTDWTLTPYAFITIILNQLLIIQYFNNFSCLDHESVRIMNAGPCNKNQDRVDGNIEVQLSVLCCAFHSKQVRNIVVFICTIMRG